MTVPRVAVVTGAGGGIGTADEIAGTIISMASAGASYPCRAVLTAEGGTLG